MILVENAKAIISGNAQLATRSLLASFMLAAITDSLWFVKDELDLTFPDVGD